MLQIRDVLSQRKDAFHRRLQAAALRVGYHTRPKFLIIGAQKAGTTALFYYLAEHPSLRPSKEKELGFFAPEIFADWPEHPYHKILCTSEGAPHFADRGAHRRALAWYHSHFPPPHRLGRHRLTFEATPEYFYYPETALRIFRYDAEMKLIVLLRDPVERAFAAWNMYSRFGEYRPHVYSPRKETRDFRTAVEEEIAGIESREPVSDPGYVRRGIYHEQFERLFAHFRRDQILVLDNRNLMSETSAVVDRAVTFLGLAPSEHDAEWGPIHVGEYATEIPGDARRLLEDFFEPHNERLYRLLDHDFEW
jgi:hypothetical protein